MTDRRHTFAPSSCGAFFECQPGQPTVLPLKRDCYSPHQVIARSLYCRFNEGRVNLRRATTCPIWLGLSTCSPYDRDEMSLDKKEPSMGDKPTTTTPPPSGLQHLHEERGSVVLPTTATTNQFFTQVFSREPQPPAATPPAAIPSSSPNNSGGSAGSKPS